MPLILRTTKGSPLTYSELDGNFTYLTGSISSSKVNDQQYQDNATPGSPIQIGSFGFVAGTATITNGAATSSIFTSLAGKTLGSTAWITTCNKSGFNPTEFVLATSISSSGAILFGGTTSGAPASGIFIFTGMFLV